MSRRYITLAVVLIAGASHLAGAVEAENYLAKARQLVASNQPEAALIEYANAVQQEPDNAEVRLQLGLLELALGNGAAAEKELAIVADSLPAQETAVPLAQARLLAGRPAAIADADAASSLAAIGDLTELTSEQRATLMGIHGQALLALDHREDASQLFEAALAQNASEVYALLGQAMLARRDSGPDETALTLARLRDIHPEFAPAWSYSGDIERERKDFSAAAAAYSKALALQPNRFSDRLHLALTHLALKDYTGAANDAQALEALRPRGAGAALIRGLIAFQQGGFAAAQVQFDAALAADRDYLPAILYAGLTAAAIGNNEQARAQLLRFTAAGPDHPVALVALAAVLWAQGDIGAARATLERALAADPANPAALDLLGRVEIAAGHPEDASVAFARLVEQDPNSALAQLKLGAALAADGQAVPAGEALTRSLQLPSSADLDPAVRIRVLLSTGQADAALAAADTLTKEQPNAAAFLTLGQVYQARRELDQAQGAYARALKLEPANPAVQQAQGRLMLARGDAASAEPLLRQVVKAQPDNLGAAILWAESLARLGRIAPAVAALEAAARAHPQAWQPRLLLARHYRSRGNPAEALTLVSALGQTSADNPLLVEEQGLDQLTGGDAAKAQETMELLVKLAPASGRARYRLAQARMALGAADQARDDLEEALRLEPKLVEAQVVLARLALAGNDLERATQLVNSLLTAQSTNPDVLALSGALAMRRGDAKAAITAYEAAMARQPAGGLAVALAMARLSAGDTAAGLAGLQTWVEAHPDDHSARLSLGNLAMVARNTRLAKTQFQTLIKNGAGTPTAHANLAQILIGEKDLNGALINAQRAVELAPQEAQLRDTVGLILLFRKDYPNALSAFNQGLALAPQDPGLHYHKAVALESLDQRAQALAALNAALDSGREFAESKDAQALRTRLSGDAEPAAPTSQRP
jgi:putative PEP-CTERM system TPR-repeat lipoprotein